MFRYHLVSVVAELVTTEVRYNQQSYSNYVLILVLTVVTVTGAVHISYGRNGVR